jgi:hypothetical protein
MLTAGNIEMPTTMTQQELASLHDEARAELKKIPGVVEVGYGFKFKGGAITDTVGFIVYVEEKKDASKIAANELIPSQFKNIPTDVTNVPISVEYDCQDTKTHSPLVGGITISNLKSTGSSSSGVGTLGFFATVNGQKAPHNVVMVSNNHVLTDSGAVVGDTIYQPPLVQQGGVWVLNPQGDNNSAATIANIGLRDNYAFTYPGETQNNYYVDAATALVNICICPWCHTNGGQTFTDQILNLALNGGNFIADIARVQQSDISAATPYVVYKVGRTSGRTVGKVIAVGAPYVVTGSNPVSGTNVMQIMPTAVDCTGVMQFSTYGDSGSAIINAAGKLVGLLVGGVAGPSGNITSACHIAPVIDCLKITPITQANPATGNPAFSTDPVAATAAVESAPATPPAAQASMLPAVRQQLEASREGGELIKLIDAHANEVVRLVNHQRKVTVAWHRNMGPQFLIAAVISAYDENQSIPESIDGVERDALLNKMASVLSDCGSTRLKAAIAQSKDRILPRIGSARTLRDLIDGFANHLATQPGESAESPA